MKRGRSSSATCSVVAASESISDTDCLSTSREFLERVEVGVQFVEKEEEKQGYQQAKLGNAHWE